MELRLYWPAHEHFTVASSYMATGLSSLQHLGDRFSSSPIGIHLGKEKTKLRARQVVFWRRIDGDIGNVVR